MYGDLYIGIDVGTGSVRAALFQNNGTLIAKHVSKISIHNPLPDYYEQSTENIWAAVICSVKGIMSSSQVKPKDVKGIGFDATCSLAVLDANGQPLTVSPSGKNEWNVIMWMDHRAKDQADRISETKHDVLKYLGGSMFLEMQTPKLLWLKENLSDTWQTAGSFYDLPDFLTWRATGHDSRSLCSVTCKWTYQSSENGQGNWNSQFFDLIGLQKLAENDFAKIGKEIKSPGENVCSTGLSVAAAAELGLSPGTTVATSIIDAHAGTLGSLNCKPRGMVSPPLLNRMSLISGTSNCHIVLSSSAKFVPGVWGPYYSSILPHLWSTEGGQSAAGDLLDHIVKNHAAFPAIKEKAEKRSVHSFSILNEALEDLRQQNKLSSVALLTLKLHMWPDFHGNRSPLADPTLRGMISGLRLSSSQKELCLHYLATVQALAYGTKHIIQELEKYGHNINVVHMCGGLRNNSLLVQTFADVVGIPFVLPDMDESVLLGAAILGAFASGNYSSIQEAMEAMGGEGSVVMPNKQDFSYHEKKYRVFLQMLDDQKAYQTIMES
ncbi:FGGY carbohydrate kinase domain-containing protein isoform X3 [Octopus sinensis]|nr:FGGY carbohydrate kinase domain-containing protein isoform X3 [Octopus sinensis]XP_036362348.1 FGGY carbohydrate kinase domain-containing protein isoform X3 [Octopus sinensis]XP_036362349.1 FGGY carbohydrate kinase domain-containing protein isoform X3 [Octopus sinensis]